MDIETINRSLAAGPIVAVSRRVPLAVKPVEVEELSPALLRDAVREAGLFQRSVLGHLDHKEWRDRVRADGQRLIDLLAEIGFRPSRQG